MRKIILVVLMGALFGVLHWSDGNRTVRAEAAQSLKYGDAVIGEISASTPLMKYTFSGAKGDLVVIDVGHYIPNKDNADYSALQTAFMVTDSTGKNIINLPDYSNNGAALLPTDGQYTIQVMAQKSATGDNTKGKFYLALSKAQILKPGLAIQGTSRPYLAAYYVLPNHRQFGLNFEQTLKDNNYNSITILSFPTPFGDKIGDLYTESTLSTKDIVSASFVFNDDYSAPIVMLEMTLVATGKNTPIDYKLGLQDNTAQPQATSAATAAVTMSASTAVATVKAATAAATVSASTVVATVGASTAVPTVPAQATNTAPATVAATGGTAVAGNYQVSGTNADGSAYKGTLSVKQTGAVFVFDWKVPTAFEGIGIQQGNIISVGYGGPTCGVIAYSVKADGTLDGQWGVVGQQLLGTEHETRAGSVNTLDGHYSVAGSNMAGAAYTGTLALQKLADVYQANWVTGNPFSGTGILRNGVLGIGFGGDKVCGIFVVQIQPDGTLDSQWVVLGQSKIGTERATKVK